MGWKRGALDKAEKLQQQACTAKSLTQICHLGSYRDYLFFFLGQGSRID